MRAAYLAFLTILASCSDRRSGDSPEAGQIESIDISPDDNSLLLLSNSRGATTVFEVNTNGQSPRLILAPLRDGLISNPRYSPDGKKIVFIKHLTKSFWESAVFLCNSDGSGVEELIHHDGELIPEAIFSAEGREVIYCAAKQYNSSKKKGTTDVRGFDIYSISLSDKTTTKLSKLDAVGIDALSEVDEKYVLFHMNAGKKSGIFFLEKNNPTKALRLFPLNGTQDSNILDKPGYAPDKFLLFTARSELYSMNLTTRKADLIYDAKGGHLIQMLTGFHSKPTVMFKKFDEPGLASINIDGTEEKAIEVEFPR